MELVLFMIYLKFVSWKNRWIETYTYRLKQCYRYTPKAKMDSVAQLGFSGVRLKIGGICPRRVHTSLLFHVLSQALSA